MSLFEKRMNYVNGDGSSSEEETCDETDYNARDENEVISKHSQKKSKRKPCFSKNALMARENRLRKKLYVSKLEDDLVTLRRDNKKLSLIIDNQSALITNLKTEMKYLKSVIANSSDISRLIRNIHQSSA